MATTNTPRQHKVTAYKLTGKQPKTLYRQGNARYLWWQFVQAQLKAGPVPTTTAHAAALATPPSTPKTGNYAGQCEPPAGWFNFFAKQGLVAKVQVPAPAPTTQG